MMGTARLAVMVLLAGCDGRVRRQEAPPPSLPPVSVSVPVARQVVDWDEFVGRFEAIQTVEVRPRVSGYVQKVAFRDGDIVKKGQLLFIIDPRPYQAALAQARADIKSAEAQAANAKVDLERAKALLDKGWVAKSAYDAKLAQAARTRPRWRRPGPGAATRARPRIHPGDLADRRAGLRSPGGYRQPGQRLCVAADPVHHRGVAGPDPLRLHRLGSGLSQVPRADQEGTRKSSRYASQPGRHPAAGRDRLRLARPDGLRGQRHGHRARARSAGAPWSPIRTTS